MKADLSQLAIDADLEEGDLILDAVLLMRVARTDRNGTALLVATTPGMDWIMQMGMVEAARHIMQVDDEDDDD